MIENKTLKLVYYTMSDDIKNIIEDCFAENEVKPIGNRVIKYYDIACSFNTKSCSFYDEEHKKVALTYIWSIGFSNKSTGTTICITGRTWSEFRDLLNILNTFSNKGKCKYYIVCYTQDLSYVYYSIKKELEDLNSNVFFLRPSVPLTAEFGVIQFRNLFELTGKRVEDLNTKSSKIVIEEEDYKKVITPITPLSELEIASCLSENIVICEYINTLKDQYGSIANLEYTKIGYVRTDLHDLCIGDEYMSSKKTKYTRLTNNICIHDLREYATLKECCSGGYAFCNPELKDVTLYNVKHKDAISKYPSKMCCEPEFPLYYMGTIEYMNEAQFAYMKSLGYAMFGEVTIKNIRTKHQNFIPLSRDRCEIIELSDELKNSLSEEELKEYVPMFEQDKLFRYKGEIRTSITSVDYRYLPEVYDWDSIVFRGVYVYRKGYLPKPVIEYVLRLYKKKTKNKNRKGKEKEYNLDKIKLNALSGCAITDPCKETLEENEYGVCKAKVNTALDILEKCKAYNRKLKAGKIILPYHWGIFILALARDDLYLAINEATKRNIFAYTDTDCIIYENDKYLKGDEIDKFEKWLEEDNKDTERKMKKTCKKLKLDEDIWKAQTDEGKVKPLGFWATEGVYKRFKSLGAKKYIKEDDNGVIVTVSGLNKEQGTKYMSSNFDDPFAAFNTNLVIPEDYTGILRHTHVIGERRGKIKDYLGNDYEYVTKGGVHIEKSAFSMNPIDKQMDAIMGIISETKGAE